MKAPSSISSARRPAPRRVSPALHCTPAPQSCRAMPCGTRTLGNIACVSSRRWNCCERATTSAISWKTRNDSQRSSKTLSGNIRSSGFGSTRAGRRGQRASLRFTISCERRCAARRETAPTREPRMLLNRGVGTHGHRTRSFEGAAEMKITAGELAQKTASTVEGDAALELAGVAAPERAGQRDLIYVEAAKHAERAATSQALCVVARPGIALPGKTVIRSDQPKVAFAKAAALLRERPPIATGIHPTAIVA